MARNSFVRFCCNSTLFIAGIVGLGVTAASAQARSRITASIADSRPVAIAHSVHPQMRAGNDLGPTAEDRMLRGLSIHFNMTDAQQAALNELLSDQQNPSSPRYQQWLTPTQYAAQFGMAPDDIAKVSAWLTGQGFTVTGVASGGSFITFDGTVGQVQRAFRTNIHNLSANGETHFANVTEVSLPSAFAGSVMAVTGLHDFRLRARLHAGTVNPQFTSSQSGSHFVSPKDLYTIYNMNPLLNSYTGSGITIAVVGQVDIDKADIAAFRSAAQITANAPTIQVVPASQGGCDPGTPSSPNSSCVGNNPPTTSDLQESALDVEWSGAMAPGATILFVTSADAFTSLVYAVNSSTAQIITTSYGNCEATLGTSEVAGLNTILKQANAQGQTVIAASGDDGGPDCDRNAPATHGLAADFPASSPYVTGLGGTQFSGDAAGTGSGANWSATQYWAGTSGSDVIGSALSYIPEAVWNNESLGANASYGGGGGGASAYFTKPVWQTGTGVPADGSRDVPDLALDGSNGHDSLLFCVSVAVGKSCGSGFRVSSSDGTLTAGGGTSFDSQIFGGMLALIEQKIGHRIGNANPTIYSLANNNPSNPPSSPYYTPGATIATSPSVVFNDVISGNSFQPCLAGTTNCGNGGSIGFNAGVGYDLTTGWGSVNATNLANAWSSATPLGVGSLGSNTSTTALTASQSSATAGATVTLTATITGSTGNPTGTIQFFANGVAISGLVTLPANGVATYAWATSCSALGQQVLTASYSGDVNYQGSKGPTLTAGALKVLVSSSNCPDFALSTSTSNISVAAGGTIPSVTVTATPSNGFTGTVTFSAVSTSSTGFTPTFSFSPASVNLTSSAAATSTLTLSGITAELRMPSAPGTAKTPWYMAGSGITLASLLLLMLPLRRRLSGLLLVVLAIALIGGATGCGSSQSGPPAATTNNNAYAGTYIVTVTGTYTSSPSNQVTQHIATVTYSIQ